VSELSPVTSPFVVPEDGLKEAFPASILRAFDVWRASISSGAIRIEDASDIDAHIHDAICYWVRTVVRKVSKTWMFVAHDD
jgi:hypothetical protein